MNRAPTSNANFTRPGSDGSKDRRARDVYRALENDVSVGKPARHRYQMRVY